MNAIISLGLGDLSLLFYILDHHLRLISCRVYELKKKLNSYLFFNILLLSPFFLLHYLFVYVPILRLLNIIKLNKLNKLCTWQLLVNICHFYLYYHHHLIFVPIASMN